jgi:DNA-binding response OmpR family regulator
VPSILDLAEGGMTRHVLVVEDDDAFRRLVVRMLVARGFEVVEAGDFGVAAKIVESDQPLDLLLTDIGMPGGTPHGVSIARFAQLRRKGLKVLFMTGGADAKEIVLLGQDEAVLQKPFSRAELADAVAAALR